MEAVSAGDSKPHQRQKHKVMLARMKLLLAFARASSASGSRYIRLDPALSEESAIALGAYVVGHVCVRGWTHLSGAAPASWPSAVQYMGDAQLSFYSTVKQATARARAAVLTDAERALTRYDDARHHAGRVLAARGAVRVAGARRGSKSVVATRPGLRETPAQRIAEHFKSAHAGTSEYPATLLGRRLVPRVETLLESSVPLSLVLHVEPLLLAAPGAAGALSLCRRNQELRDVLLAHALPAVIAADFELSGPPPKVGIIYVEMVTMLAKWWHAEAQRVLVRGESLSRMSHRPHHITFQVMLANMMPLAAAAVDAGRGDSQLLTGLYSGQELRQEGHLGARADGHMGPEGNEIIRELAARTSKRDTGRIVTPLGGPVIIEVRYIALLPPETDQVNFAEDALRCLLRMIPGSVLLNSSPASGDRRYLHEMPAGPPLLYEALSELLQENESGKIRMAQRLPHEGVPPFLRSALVTAAHLLKAGRFSGDDGEVLQPELALSTSAGGGRTFSQLQCAAALLAGNKSAPRRVLLHLNACTCSRLAPVCECILACRIVHES